MRARIKGDARENLREELKHEYEVGRRPVRALAQGYQLSYGLTLALLREAGAEIRSRGGDRRSKAVAGGR
ncbi:MAG: transcriptional regulator [Streptomyces sp.]|nr:transcriptional regulator [Streptomyces sp.]